MENAFATHKIRVHRLDAALAEVRIEFPELPAGIEVRGRLMGPRCPGRSTVEVAFPLRPVPGCPVATFQVLIPEPSCWTPDLPNRYEGPVEFFREGAKTGAVRISLSLKEPV